MIQVVNKKFYNGPGEYIGRPTSALKNQYVMKDRSLEERTRVLKEYENWLKKMILINDPTVIAELDRLYYIWKNKGSLVLVCWCAPLQCHGDIIKSVLESAKILEEMV